MSVCDAINPTPFTNIELTVKLNSIKMGERKNQRGLLGFCLNYLKNVLFVILSIFAQRE